jgi:hypothetical protein
MIYSFFDVPMVQSDVMGAHSVRNVGFHDVGFCSQGSSATVEGRGTSRWQVHSALQLARRLLRCELLFQSAVASLSHNFGPHSGVAPQVRSALSLASIFM